MIDPKFSSNQVFNLFHQGVAKGIFCDDIRKFNRLRSRAVQP